MAITVTINKYVEGFSAVPSANGGNGTDLLGKETWSGTTPIVNSGRALEDSEGNIKTFATSLTGSSTKVGTRYLNTIYWKEEGTAYLSEVGDNWEYDGTKNIIINLYYGKTSGSTDYKPSEEELGPVTPSTPTYEPWSTTIEYYIDNTKTTFFQDVYEVETYPTSITDLQILRVSKYGTTGVVIEYKKSGSSTMEEYIISAPTGLNYSSISGASIGVEYNYSNKPSVIKLYFTKNTSLTYTVNVAPNPLTGGTTSKSPSTVYYSDKVTISATPKTGYKFSKWSISNSTGGTPKEVATSSHTFYILDTKYNCTAYFTPYTYTITYKDKGGSTFSGTHASGSPTTHTYGTSTTLKSPTKTGYTFGGWFTSPDCSGSGISTLSSTGYTSDITLYAKWTANSYNITYKDKGGSTFSGTHASGYPTTHTYGTSTTLKSPTKTGYTFGGWFTSPDCSGSGVSTLSSTGYTADITLYAKWTAKTATITWNPNGGSVSPTTSSYTYDGAIIELPIPTRTGYTFNGWYTSASVGIKITNIGSTTKPTANVTYYAQWTVNTYTITYKDKGGSTFSGTHASGYPTTHTYGTATALKTASKTGYTFGGWFTSSNCSGTALTSLAATGYTSNITLYAKWIANSYTITYKDKGGETFSGSNSSSLPSKHTYGTTTTLVNGSKTGYTFDGWYLDSDCKDDKVTSLSSTGYTSDIILYTKWTAKTVTITWNPNNGSVSPTSSSYTYDGAVVTLPTPTRTGYTFSGWYTALTGGTKISEIGTTNKPTANVTYYAHWTPNSYTITYKDKGGSTLSGTHASGYPTTHTYGTATALKTASKTGYTFGGWFTSSDCSGTAVTSLSATGYTSNITLYAKWTAINYTITYNTNGGNSIAQKTYTIETATFSLPTPTRDGYTFKGWYSNGSFSGSTTTQIAKGSTGDRTYYAKWEGNACTITVNANPSELTSRLSGGGNYRNGDNVTISAPSGYDVYKFINWTKSNSVVSTTTTYNFTANGNATYVANFIDNRKSALFKIHILDDSYNETGLCNVEIRYGDLDNPVENTITRAGNKTIEITGPSSTCSVIKTHISGTNFLDKVNGALTSQLFYAFPESINNEPFINILYNGNVIENEYSYTNNSLEFDVYYGNLPKNESGGGSGEPGDSDNSEITVRFKYYLDGKEIDTSNAAYISWPERNISELKCYWFKYDSYTKNDREIAITGITDRIQFSYVDTYWGDPAKSGPYSNLKNVLEIQAPSFTGLADSVYLTGVDTHDTNKTYTYVDCPTNQLDICIYFESYEFNAYVYSNLPEYGDAYIAQKGTTHVVFHASDVAPTAIRFDAEVLNDAYEFNRWVNYNDENEVALSTENPWTIHRPQAQDYHIEAIFTGRQLNVALDPNDGTAHAWWQHVGIVAGTKRFKTVSFNLDEAVRKPSDRTGYEFLGWYTSKTNEGYLIIDKNGALQANVPGWTTSDGLWIKGPTVDTSECTHNVIVYAKWKPIEYTITYTNLKGATNPTDNPSTYTIETPTITFVAPTKNLPRGYTWSKWNPSSIAKSSTGNKTITAEWLTNKYTLTWNLNGGTVTTVGTCAPLNSTGTVSGQVDYLSNITAPIVSKNGYKFEGWSVNGVDVITPASKMPDGNITYIAVYSIKTYKISVNSIPTLDKVYIKVNDVLKGTTTTCTTNDKITLIAENVNEYLLSYWQKSGGNVVSGQNEFTFTANDTYLDDAIDNNIFTAYYEQDPRATLKINFIVDDFIEKTAIFKFNGTFSFLGDSSTDGYRCEIQGEAECIEGNISINQGYFFIPSKYNGEDICVVPNEQGSGTSKLICSNKGITIGRDGNNSQYYEDNTVKNKYCPTGFEWKAYLPTNIADETHLVFPSVEKDEYGVLYGPLVIDVYYGEIPERFLPVVPDDVEITTVSGLTLLQRIQNKIATFKWLNNLFGEPEKTSWDSYDNSGLKEFLKDDSKETPLSMHCIEYGDLQIYNQETGNENINLDKTIKQYSLTLDKIIKPLNGQIILDVSKIEGNKIYFNISNSNGFANTSNGIYIYFSVNNETDENNLVAALLQEYDVDEDTARSCVAEFVKKLDDNGFLG